MKHYLEYKDSGYDWIGKMPTSWIITNLGYHTTMIVPMRDKPIDLTGEIPWLRIEDFNGKYVSSSKSHQGVTDETVKLMNLKVFPVGTVLCSCSCNMGKTAIVKSPLITNQTFIGIVPNDDVSSDYLYYLMNCAEQYLNMISTGAIQSYLSRQNFEQLRIPFPLRDEQDKISNFLDNKTNEIDALIAMKQRLIELLQEERTALINQAVTKGLNPDVPMKDSEIEWLGEIPEHWKVSKLKRLLKEGKEGIKIGPFGSSLKIDKLTEVGYKVYGQENIINNDFTLGRRYISPEYYKEMENYSLKSGDVVITMMGTTGKSQVFPMGVEEGIMDSHLIRLKLNEEKYLSRLFSLIINDSASIFHNIKIFSKGSIMEGLNSSIIRGLIIPVPPLREQQDILSFIETRSEEIRSTIRTADQQINLLHEYKTSLINEAVTGKIDVRDHPINHAPSPHLQRDTV